MIIKSRDRKNPEGAVLIFALIVMLLMGLMATALFLNTRSELVISRNTYMGRDAFTKADSAARIAIMLSRTLLYPTLGPPSGYFTDNSGGNSPFTVEMSPDFNLETLLELAGEGLESDIMNRYLVSTAAHAPHITIKHDGNIVATAAVALNYSNNGGMGPLPQPGSSIDGSGHYGNNDGANIQAIVVVTATGRIPLSGDDKRSDYYSGNVESPHSVITAIYKETLP
ncbi:hypothetical protein C4J81_02770 [Deltaproteobacteria bacterium Smac51]|nr:hypothetical protein C4J81_02770 [Deltaproteobacteria bacterium Smac51]